MDYATRTTAAALLLGCAWLAAAPADVITAELKRETAQAFESYIRSAESGMEERLNGGKTFLWAAESPEREKQVRAGNITTERWTRDEVEVPGGLIHDWIGAVFIPGVSLAHTLALVQSYEHHENIYKPEVIDARLLSREGDHFKVYLRLLKKKVLTVVLNTEHDVRYFRLDAERWHSRSYSTRIAEVHNAGKPDERELPVGRDHGFLWKLYSYWKFQEKDGGTYVECRAISLTRNVPAGLGWLIRPIIRNLPAESLENTLRATRDALRRPG